MLFDSDPVQEVQNRGETTLRLEEDGNGVFNSNNCISHNLTDTLNKLDGTS